MLGRVFSLLFHTGRETILASDRLKNRLNIAEGLMERCVAGLKELEENAKLHGINIAETSDWREMASPLELRTNVNEIRLTLVELQDRYRQEGSPSQSNDALFCQDKLLRDIEQIIMDLEGVKSHINRSVSVTARDPLRDRDDDSPLDEMRGRPDLHQSLQASDPTRIVKNLWDVESDTSPADSPATTPTAASFHLSNSMSHVQPRVKRRVDNIPGGLSGCVVLDI